VENLSLQAYGKLLVILGVVVLTLGLLLMFSDRLPMLFKLPGDIIIRKKNFTFYFPITSLIIMNLILFLVLFIIGKFRGN